MTDVCWLSKNRVDFMKLSYCEIGEAGLYEFYLKYGFIDTGGVEKGEQVL